MFPYSNRHHLDPVPGAPALEVRDLNVEYPATRRLALHHVSLRVPLGARVALVGSNGAGKSTLLKAVAGLLPAIHGTIAILGRLESDFDGALYLAEGCEVPAPSGAFTGMKIGTIV